MRFNQLKQFIRPILDTGTSVELISSPGAGKSEVVAQIVREQSKADGNAWGFSKMFLATQTPPDLIGYQFKGERTWPDGQGGAKVVAVTEPTLPLWMMTVDGQPVANFERGILFLDEYGQGETDVKRASAELLLNRQLGPWKLPNGWSVIAASNRQGDRSGVTKSLDFVINRRIEINITLDVDSWVDWATENNVDPIVIAFARQNSEIMFDGKVPDKQGPWCTPRSLVMAADTLNEISKRQPVPSGVHPDWASIPVDPICQEIGAGMIGAPAMAQLAAFVKLGHEMPPFEEIVSSPSTVKIPEKPDGRMLVMYNLASRVTAQNCSPIIVYMQRMPQAFASGFVQGALRRDPALIRNPDMRTWITTNKELLSAFGSVKR